MAPAIGARAQPRAGAGVRARARAGAGAGAGVRGRALRAFAVGLVALGAVVSAVLWGGGGAMGVDVSAGVRGPAAGLGVGDGRGAGAGSVGSGLSDGIDAGDSGGDGAGDGSGATSGAVSGGAADPTPGAAAADVGRGVPEASFWVDPESGAARQAAEWRRTGRAADAALMDRIATRAQAEWLTGSGPREVVEARTRAAAREGRTAVLVAYYIPHRDCGSYSGGGARSATGYREWVDEFAAGLGDRSAYVIVEPDAVAQTVGGCEGVVPGERYGLLAYAVDRFKQQANTRVYLDAGNPAWHPDTSRLVEPLRRSGIAGADGFAVNVSNFETGAVSSAYGTELSAALGGKHFVIDSSRNGNGPYAGAESWCNPPGRALGAAPTTVTGAPLVDAILWVKRPGESDGTCRGGPAAGQWWPAYALELARNARG